MSIVALGKFRIDQVVTWLAGEQQRRGRITNSLRERDGTHTLWVMPDDGGPAVTVIEAQVLAAGQDGIAPPDDAVGAVNLEEARALARAVLTGGDVRRPVQQQLRTLAMAVLGEPAPAASEVQS